MQYIAHLVTGVAALGRSLRIARVASLSSLVWIASLLPITTLRAWIAGITLQNNVKQLRSRPWKVHGPALETRVGTWGMNLSSSKHCESVRLCTVNFQEIQGEVISNFLLLLDIDCEAVVSMFDCSRCKIGGYLIHRLSIGWTQTQKFSA